MQQLVALLEHPPAIAVIEGEAGVGKSRLVHELLDRAPGGTRRLVGRAHRVREPFPLGPVADALRCLEGLSSGSDAPPLLGALVPLLPELADRLPPPPIAPGEPLVARHLLFRAALLLIERLGPTICVLEDLHWSDEATIEFLRFLTLQCPTNLALVLTCRGAEATTAAAVREVATQHARGHAAGTVLELAPLGRDAMVPLLGALLDTDEVSEQFAGYVYERTAGLPLAVEEVVRLMYERGLLVRGGTRWFRRSLERLGVPRSISDAVLQRLGTLAEPGHSIAEAAAVLDMAAEPTVLWAVAGLSPGAGLDGLRQVLRSGLLVPGSNGRYGFRHALAAEAVREAIPEPERSRLHRRAAEALEELPHLPVARLAHHYHRSGRLEQWQRYAEAAADAAMAQGDPAAAAQLLQQLLTEAELAGQHRARVTINLGRAALYGLTRLDEAIALLRTAVEDPQFDESERGEMRAHLVMLLGAHDQPESALVECARAVEELHGSPATACELLIQVSSWWSVPPDVRERLGDDAVDIATRLGDAPIEERARASRLMLRLYLGDTTAWDEIEAAAGGPSARVAPDEDAAWHASRLCAAAYFLGDYRRALRYLDDELRYAEAAGYDAFEPVAETDAILLKWAIGDWNGLEERAARLATVTADRPMSSVPGRLVHAFFALIRGALDEAEREYAETAEVARGAGIVPAQAAALKGLARVYLHRGELDAACVAALEGLRALIKTGYWVWVADVVTIAVEVLLRAGRLDDASAVVDEFETGLAGTDAPICGAAMHVCRGLLAQARGTYRAADAELLAGECVYQELPSPYEGARTAAARGLCALQAGDAAAELILRDACERLLAMGAKLEAAQLRRTLRELTQATVGRRGRKGYGAALSPREERVVELASRGLTNKEIAAILFLSANTVAHHLSSAMEKLGARTRMALAERWKQGQALPINSAALRWRG